MPAQQARFSRYVMSSPVKSCTLDPVPAFLVREFTYLLLPYLTVMVKPVCWHLRNMPLCHRWSRNLVLTGLMRPTTGPFQITHLKGRWTGRRQPAAWLSCCQQSAAAMPVRMQRRTLDGDGHAQGHGQMLYTLPTIAYVMYVQLLIVRTTSCWYRQEFNFGLKGAALGWIQSFLTGRTQQVASLTCGNQLSLIRSVPYGVSQGSALGPLLFILYPAELEYIVARHGMQLHQYADDCQV